MHAKRGGTNFLLYYSFSGSARDKFQNLVDFRGLRAESERPRGLHLHGDDGRGGGVLLSGERELKYAREGKMS